MTNGFYFTKWLKPTNQQVTEYSVYTGSGEHYHIDIEGNKTDCDGKHEYPLPKDYAKPRTKSRRLLNTPLDI